MIYETRRFSGKVELSTMWKRFVLTTAFVCLFLVLAACDDDSSSFVEPVPEDSSSSVEDESSSSSSSVTLSGASAESNGSSSNKESSSSAKSSSSVTPKSSSSETSVSSSNKESSSSSAKSSSSVSSSSAKSSSSESSSSVKSSSSSAKSSSSEKSSSSAKSSSSVSSSSSIKSSSSYDHTLPLSGRLFDEYKQFTDERNGRSYYYITIRGKNSKGEADSVTVMAENLNIGKMITYVKDQADDTTIERYCYDRDTTNCDRYGGLYQWAEMMQLPSRCNTESCAGLIQENHQGICPDGWRLLTQEDFYIVMHADNNEHGIEDVRSNVFGGYNYTGYSLVGAGYVWDRRLQGLKSSTAWFYPEEGREGYVEGYALAMGANNTETEASEVFSQLKTNGFSVRCVKLEE